MEQQGIAKIVWRTARAFLLLVVIAFSLLLLISLIGLTQLSRYIMHPAMILAALLSIYLDKKDPRILGIFPLKGWFKNFCLGVTLGAASVITVVIGLMLLEDVQADALLNKDIVLAGLLSGLIFNVVVAFGEETFFRGYLISLFTEKMRSGISITLAAIFFSAIHFINPEYYWFEYFYAFLIALLFGLMYVNTGSLYMPIGFHFIFNFLQSSLVTMPARGGEVLFLFVLALNFILVAKYFPKEKMKPDTDEKVKDSHG